MMKICVVDDEKTVREAIVRKLERLNKPIEVFDVGSGYEALDTIRLIRPELLITDIMIPELSGLDMLAMLKKENNHTEIALISGYDEFNFARKAIQHGAVRYLLKPVQMEELIELIELVDSRLIDRWKADMKERVWELKRHSLSIGELESKQIAAWFDDKTPIVIRWSEQPVSEDAEVVFTFNVNDRHRGEVRTADPGASNVFYDRSEFASRLRRAEEQWQNERFFGERRQPAAADGSDYEKRLLRQMQKLHDQMLKDAKGMHSDDLHEHLEQWFLSAEPLHSSKLKKQCAYLIAALDNVMTSSKEVSVVTEEQVMHWLEWVGGFATWEELKISMSHFIVDGLKALHECTVVAQNLGLTAQVLRLLEQSSDPQTSLNTIAAQLNVHPVTISKTIRQETGKKFVDLLVARKIEIGKNLLMQSDKTVIDIALETGYSDFRYFSKLFKKTYGLTPNEFRQTKKSPHQS
ncbi:response regulator [Paenibacillus oryzisoli]|uniref:response regulator transcription factor n=1 Tax=Paenibacillus oryzisoli TaxID=1850517 RepID=UPI003D2B06BE